jgi:hypothetical protein
MAGLPGAGASTVADALGHRLSTAVVSVDPIESARHRWREPARRARVLLLFVQVDSATAPRMTLDSMSPVNDLVGGMTERLSA